MKYGIFEIIGKDNKRFKAYVEYIHNPFEKLSILMGDDDFYGMGWDIVTGTPVIDCRGYRSVRGILESGQNLSDKLAFVDCVWGCRDIGANGMREKLNSLTEDDIIKYNENVNSILQQYEEETEDYKKFKEARRAYKKARNEEKNQGFDELTKIKRKIRSIIDE